MEKLYLLQVGSPLIKCLPYFSKTQFSLPRGKTIWVKGSQANPERRQTFPPQVRLSFPNHQYRPILILPLWCRNYPSTSCRLYNRAIQPQGGIRSACGCIPWFFTQGLIKLNFVISRITMNVDSLSINPFIFPPIEWTSVYYEKNGSVSSITPLLIVFIGSTVATLSTVTLNQYFNRWLSNLPIISNFPCAH